MSDKINPAHYRGHPAGVECIDVIEHFPANIANAMKYLWRAGEKPGEPAEDDLAKAIWYVRRELLRRLKLAGLPAEGPAVAKEEPAPAEAPSPGGASFLAALEAAWPCYQTREGTWQAMSGVYFTDQGEGGTPVAARWKCSPSKAKAISEAMRSIAKKGGWEG